MPKSLKLKIFSYEKMKIEQVTLLFVHLIEDFVISLLEDTFSQLS